MKPVDRLVEWLRLRVFGIPVIVQGPRGGLSVQEMSERFARSEPTAFRPWFAGIAGRRP